MRKVVLSLKIIPLLFTLLVGQPSLSAGITPHSFGLAGKKAVHQHSWHSSQSENKPFEAVGHTHSSDDGSPCEEESSDDDIQDRDQELDLASTISLENAKLDRFWPEPLDISDSSNGRDLLRPPIA